MEIKNNKDPNNKQHINWTSFFLSFIVSIIVAGLGSYISYLFSIEEIKESRKIANEA